MTNEEFLKFHKETIDKMHEICKRKNADYTGGNGAFANFVAVENINITSTEQGFLTRMMDKIMRINAFVQKGTLQVSDESVTDTLLDLANYSILMAGYIKSKKAKAMLASENTRKLSKK